MRPSEVSRATPTGRSTKNIYPLTCKQCGYTGYFRIRRQRAQQQFCCKKCEREWQADHHRRIELVCQLPECSARFMVRPSLAKRKYCCWDCYTDAGGAGGVPPGNNRPTWGDSVYFINTAARAKLVEAIYDMGRPLCRLSREWGLAPGYLSQFTLADTGAWQQVGIENFTKIMRGLGHE